MTSLAPNVWNGYESDKKCRVDAEFFDVPLEPCKWGKCTTLLDPNDRDATWRHMSAHILASPSKILAGERASQCLWREPPRTRCSPVYSCSSYMTQDLLKKHLLEKHLPMTQRYTCPICTKTVFMCRKECKDHLEIQHGTEGKIPRGPKRVSVSGGFNSHLCA